MTVDARPFVTEPLEPTAPPSEDELGVIDDLPFSGGFSRNELIDTREITVEQLRTMVRKDGQARAIYRVFSLPLRTAEMTFEPQEGEGSDGERERDFVRDVLTRPPHMGGMTTSIEHVRASMARAIVDGFFVGEKVWQAVPHPDLGAAWTYRKLAPRAAPTITFLLDDNGGLDGVRQRVMWQNRRVDVVIPAEKLMVYTVQHEENPWYGESMLLPAFYHYDVKHKLYYVAHLAYQFHAVPGRIGTHPQGADRDEKRAFRRQLASMGANTAMTKATGWEVEEFGGKGGMPDFEKILNHHDALMARSVLAHVIQLGSGTATGSWALSNDQSDLLIMAIEAILREMANVFTFYVIPQLVDYNFKTRAYPVMNLGPLADATKEMMSDLFEKVITGGGQTDEFTFELERTVATYLNLDIDYDQLKDEIEAEREQEKALAEKMQKAIADGALRNTQPQPPNEPPRDPTQVAASEIIALADKLRAGQTLAAVGG